MFYAEERSFLSDIGAAGKRIGLPLTDARSVFNLRCKEGAVGHFSKNLPPGRAETYPLISKMVRVVMTEEMGAPLLSQS